MAPSANAVKPSGDISLSDTNTPTSPSKGESAGYSLRSGLKAILSTPALKHPIPDISLSDATLEGSGLFADESVTPFSQKNNFIGPLPSKEESVSKPLEKAKELTERAASPVKNKSKSIIDSTRQRAASTADAAKSTAGSALHTVEDKASETYAYAKRKAEESLDYAKHAAGDGIKYAKQKTGLAEDQASSSLKEMKDGARKGVAEAKDKASDVAIQAKETAKSARPSSPVKSPIVAEHAGVLESLAGSAKNLAEKLGHAIHHPLGGTHATGAPMATPVTVLPSSPTKSASARTSSARISSAPKIPTTSGQKVPIGADMEDEEVIFE